MPSYKGKKVKVHTLDIAPLRSESPPQKRSYIFIHSKGHSSRIFIFTMRRILSCTVTTEINCDIGQFQ